MGGEDAPCKRVDLARCYRFEPASPFQAEAHASKASKQIEYFQLFHAILIPVSIVAIAGVASRVADLQRFPLV